MEVSGELKLARYAKKTMADNDGGRGATWARRQAKNLVFKTVYRLLG